MSRESLMAKVDRCRGVSQLAPVHAALVAIVDELFPPAAADSVEPAAVEPAAVEPPPVEPVSALAAAVAPAPVAPAPVAPAPAAPAAG